ncbi:translocator protein [Plakobranchus ocellatus]|uniref:Translocator protein n=1 Tax=Plakobranchus ocellatus TaxID=259542 RepID=A0AAV4AI01_9GAST|nr:translocator protein [Plakobranchus ocellatus]
MWTLLYGTMGYASYMVWRDGGGFGGDAALPLAWYGTQLALNWAWTPIFFGCHSFKWAFVDIVALWGAIAGTIYMFHGVNETAGYLMIPYLGWVTFAGVLNFTIWRLNPSVEDKKE